MGGGPFRHTNRYYISSKKSDIKLLVGAVVDLCEKKMQVAQIFQAPL